MHVAGRVAAAVAVANKAAERIQQWWRAIQHPTRAPAFVGKYARHVENADVGYFSFCDYRCKHASVLGGIGNCKCNLKIATAAAAATATTTTTAPATATATATANEKKKHQ
jgi:hypothetical protein